MKNLNLTRNDSFMPKLDRQLIKPVEQSIINRNNYRNHELWPVFLLKINQFGFIYVVLSDGEVLYSKDVPQGSFDETINVGAELRKLDVKDVEKGFPDYDFISSVNGLGGKLSTGQIPPGANFFSGLKVESLY